MKFLRNFLDKQEKHFTRGGKLEKLFPIFEMTDTILYTSGKVTKEATHVRDVLDLKRMMIMVVIALVPAVLMAFYNTGYQMQMAQNAAYSFGGCLRLGLLKILPIILDVLNIETL